MAVINLTQQDFTLFQGMLEQSCGIVISEKKQYLLTSRLRRLLNKYQLSSYGELARLAQRPDRRSVKQEIIDAMTTNETLWFRDGTPYRTLEQKILPELQTQRDLRIWCCACSTGQEPYSIAMQIEEYTSKRRSAFTNNIKIVATDLSQDVLDVAQLAQYQNMSLNRGLSEQRKQRYFDQVGDDSFQLQQKIRQQVEFRRLNLLESFAVLGRFDIVFCRNVLIYFRSEIKLDIIRRIHRCLNPGGYLILGAAETLSALTDLYQVEKTHPGICYRALPLGR